MRETGRSAGSLDHVTTRRRVSEPMRPISVRGVVTDGSSERGTTTGRCITDGSRTAPYYRGSHTVSGRRTRLGFLCGREAGRLVRPEARRRAMARVADHLSVEDLEARLRSAQDPTAPRPFQVIWLLARGHTIADVAAVTSFVPRWIEQLLARYNAHGPEALGDLRRRNGSAPSVLRP